VGSAIVVTLMFGVCAAELAVLRHRADPIVRA
jgi:hypothetical protein